MMTHRYAVALSLVACILLINYWLSERRTQAMKQDGRIINISGMQRMLSQRIALHALELRHAPERADADRHAHVLAEALELMRANHGVLTRQWRERAAEGDVHYAAYLDQDGLDAAVRGYLARGRHLLETYRSQDLAALQLSALSSVVAMAVPEHFLERLDAVVTRYEHEFEKKMHGLARLQSVLFGVGLLVLLLEVLFIFRPMAATIARTIATLERANDELADQALVLAATNDELSDYAHVASHDLSTPVRNVQNLTLMLREDLGGYLASPEADPEIARNLDRLERQALKSQALITGILDYSSVGVRDEALSSVDVAALVRQIVDDGSLGVRADQVVIEGELPTFETHATRLGQVFTNLIENAFRYHHDRENARVRVSVTHDGAFYRFAVSDDGPGIEPRFHERIFKSFTRLQTDRVQEGSGIGLAIVRKAVEQLGGQVDIESEPGHGTTFRFDWPVASLRRAA